MLPMEAAAMPNLCRTQQLAKLAQHSFDVLVIGGGATGAGIALDAASRGLSVALVEQHDFAAGTSSRSSKLIHGGVRYLQAAVTRLDRAQWRLVREALAERAILLRIAPHLVRPLRTLIPVHSWFERCKYHAALWLYDRAAGSAMIAASHFLSRAELLAAVPNLARHGLKGAVAYYDAQFDDARMVIALLLTAVREGAVIANHVEVTRLLETNGRLCGVQAVNRLNDEPLQIRASVIINATGPQADRLRHMENPQAKPLVTTSRGSHIVLDHSWTPTGDALLLPHTSDGRVLFVLPWQQHTLVGTTDVAAEVQNDPQPEQAEIDYLLAHLHTLYDPPPSRHHILASWAGLRPLTHSSSSNTAHIVREHHLERGNKDLITITGGKWTTYRKMAEESVDLAIASAQLTPTRSCHTQQLQLVGACGFSDQLVMELAHRYALDNDIAQHLAHAYGSCAHSLLAAASSADRQRILAGYPYLQAEIVWAYTQEMAMSAADIVQRRLRLGFLDQKAAQLATQRVQERLVQLINAQQQKQL